MRKGPEEIRQSDYLLERICWLIRLRWVAAAGVFGVTFLLPRLFQGRLEFNPPALYAIAGFLLCYNAGLYFTISCLKKKKEPFSARWGDLLANVQISIDLACLVFLIHFSGGAENPFIFYFIFHMIIASILLTRLAAFLQAAYAVALFSALVLSEHYGLLPHYCLRSVFSCAAHGDALYPSGVSFVFVSTLYITVFLATSISSRLRERDKSLEEVNKLLREKDHIKSEYVVRVTHDIRQDLAAIQSCIEPVTMGITGPLVDAQKDLLRRAMARSAQLIVFVDALLDVTRLKLSRRLKLESFSFTELARGLSAQMSDLAAAKRLSFESVIPSAPVMVSGVRVYLEEALLNLLSNSLKYTPAGGKIVFTVAAPESSVSVRVEDTGIGIPGEDLPHIFEEFYRAGNARSCERSGTGLGLSITKQIVKLHEGRIWAESAPGKGTIFHLVLPAVPGGAAPEKGNES